MRKIEIIENIEQYLINDRNVILIGCYGDDKEKIIRCLMDKHATKSNKKIIDFSFYKSYELLNVINKNTKKYSQSIIYISNIFHLKNSFSIINFLYDKHITLLATSDAMIPFDDVDYSSISGRFVSINVFSTDYRDYIKEQPRSSQLDFFLNDYPLFNGDSTILEIIQFGLHSSKRIKKQSDAILSLMKYILKNIDRSFSYHSLSKALLYSVNTVKDYINKMIKLNLLYSVKKINLKDDANAQEQFKFYPTYNSFFQISYNGQLTDAYIKHLYVNKLITKLLSYEYSVVSLFSYSTIKGVENRYVDYGYKIIKDNRNIYLEINDSYDEKKAKKLLDIKDASPKYFVLLTDQDTQILNNGISLIGINQLIVGDIKALLK